MDVTDRPGIPDAALLVKVYYTVGLFVLGGLDLGTPTGGPPAARALLWVAYFLCPAITASAVIEGVVRALNPQRWMLQRARGHVIVGGCGRLSSLYMRRLRERNPDLPLFVVESHLDAPLLDEAREVLRAAIVHGDVSNALVLDSLHLERARRVHLMTGSDFVNLEAATAILERYPNLRGKVVLHVSDITMLRLLPGSNLLEAAEIFNSHQIAARHLVDTQLMAHFERTVPRDVVVLAGFGRFGQTILAELQARAGEAIHRVVIIDTHAHEHAALFDEQVGFDAVYELDLIDGNMGDPRVWAQVRERLAPEDDEPVFVLGSSDDGNNIRIALWLSGKFPKAYTVALSFRQSAFARHVSEKCAFDVVSAADLVAASMPDAWFDR